MGEINSLKLRDYQRVIYPYLYETLSKNDYCILVTTTGTGKSFLTIKYLLDLKNKSLNNNFKFMLIVPTHVIRKGWEKNLSAVGIEPSLYSIITYNTFINICRSEMSEHFLDYDCFIFDEVHHAGSKTRNDIIYNFIHNHKGKKLGLTADPIRYSDSGRDMSIILFDGNIVYGYDLSEAIKLRILPKFKYYCGVLGIPEWINKHKKYIGKRIDPLLLQKLNVCIQEQGTVADILHRSMPPGVRKGIIFCSDISEIPICQKLVESAYPKAKYFVINSKKSPIYNKKMLDEFDNCKTTCFLLSVNMVNEGIHLHNINTLIMFRKTSVPTVFYQQIGRAMSGQDMGYYQDEDGHDIAVFDFVCNSVNLHFSELFEIESIREEGSGISRLNSNNSNLPFILQDTVGLDILNVLEEIKYYLDDSWTKEEESIIKQYYITEQKRITSRLPNRTWRAIKVKASRMNIKIELSWTEKEIEILKNNVGMSPLEIQSLLPYSRSVGAINKKRQELQLVQKRKVWSLKETNFLRDNYKNGIEFLLNSDTLERWDEKSIRTKLKKMGLAIAYRPWSEEDRKYLLMNFNKLSKEVLCDVLDRSYDSIKSEYQRLIKKLA